MLENKMAQHYNELGNKYHEVTADYKMKPWDYVIRARTFAPAPPIIGAKKEGGKLKAGPPTPTAITITLPPVSNAKGRFYAILARYANKVGTITITDADDSEDWKADIVMKVSGSRMLFYSDGMAWYPLLAKTQRWPSVATTTAPVSAYVTTLAPGTFLPTVKTLPIVTEVPPTTAPTTEAPIL